MSTVTLSKEAPYVDLNDGLVLAQAVVDTMRDPLLVLDHDLRVIAAGRSFCQTFRLVREDVRGHLLYEIDGGQWDIPELRELLEAISNGQSAIEGYEVEREFPAIGHRIMLLNARKVFYEAGAHSSVLLAFEDVTDRRAVERQVQDLMREKDMLLEEIQHRVANSLQIVASILILKARAVQSEETRLQLEDAHRRVLSIAAVQKHLHVSGGGKPIEVSDYLVQALRNVGAIDDRLQSAYLAHGRSRRRCDDLARRCQRRTNSHRIGNECAETCFPRYEARRRDYCLLQSRGTRMEIGGFR